MEAVVSLRQLLPVHASCPPFPQGTALRELLQHRDPRYRLQAMVFHGENLSQAAAATKAHVHPLWPEASTAAVWSSSMVRSMSCRGTTRSRVVSPGICAQEPGVPPLTSVLAGLILTLFPLAPGQRFWLSYTGFPQGAAALAEGLSCALGWVCGSQLWPALGTPDTSERLQVTSPSQHLHPAQCMREPDCEPAAGSW